MGGATEPEISDDRRAQMRRLMETKEPINPTHAKYYDQVRIPVQSWLAYVNVGEPILNDFLADSAYVSITKKLSRVRSNAFLQIYAQANAESSKWMKSKAWVLNN